MTNTTDTRNAPQDPQSIQIVVPYWPALKDAVGSVNAALVVTYLELKYPSPLPEPPRRYGLPVEVDFAGMADDLAIDRRTLGIALLCVCTWFRGEKERIGAVRAGREFLNRKHSKFPALKHYSIVAAREWRALETLTIRRNWPLLEKTLAECGVAHHIEPHRLPRREYAEIAAEASGLGRSPVLDQLLHLDKSDRRRTRYSRLRKAIEGELVQQDVLKVKRGAIEATEAIDPTLGDELAARLSRRRR
jgi:hypothetical protein